ncbi:efflux transporter outer membrane subunit [Pigmentiphaga litoralis]|uniref:efflux transporter outer membrane subunit n=1 Tax=Pigmentiphaga litoralis TaxID=516702 RepID=UPI003B43AD29
MHVTAKTVPSRQGLFMVLALGLGGCAGPSAPTPGQAPSLPATWSRPAPSAGPLSDAWWDGFSSAELRDVLDAATTGSQDLAAAVARVRQADARVRAAGAALLPQVSTTVTASRQAQVGRTTSGTVSSSAYTTGLAASYEVDFWGRNQAVRDTAVALRQASHYDRDTVRITVTTGAASLWLRTVAARERTTIAVRNVDTATRLLDTVTARARAGAAGPLEVAQQRGLVAALQRNVDALRQEADDLRIGLSVLVGRPGLAMTTAQLTGILAPPVDTGVPSQLMARRPDIARAEAQLAAADANVAAARAALFPRLTLQAGLGVGGTRPSALLDHPLYSLVAGLAAPIFDAGFLAAQGDLASAEREALLASYRQSVIAGFAEVELGLNALSGVAAQIQAQTTVVAEAARALAFAESRFRAGADTLLVLLDAQRTLYSAQDLAVQLDLARLLATVDLYRALGGGWSSAGS